MATQAIMGALGLGLGILTVTGQVQLWQVYLFALAARLRRRLRRAGAPDVRVRTRRRTEPVQRRRAQLGLLQRRPHDRPGGRGSPRRRRRRRLGVPHQRGHLRRRADLAEVPAHPRTAPVAAGETQQGRAGRRLPLRVEAARHQGDPDHGVPDRNVRPQLPDLHLDDVGERVPQGGGRIRPAVVDHGDRVGRGRTAVGAAGAASRRAAVRGRRVLRCRLRDRRTDAQLLALRRRARSLVGISAQTLMTTANGVVQMTTDPKLRGRVMAIYMAIFMGGTPIGAPIVGWVADAFGPRWALGVGAASGFAAALVGVFYLVKYRNLRVQFRSWRVQFVLGDREDVEEAIGAGEAAAQRA